MEKGPSPIHRELRGEVLLVTVDHPPVNSLSRDVREALWALLDEVPRLPHVRAVVLTGQPGTFLAGADLKELDSPRPPFLRDVLTKLEALPVPVVAAVDGAALGGGLETALACHARVASPSSRLGLPEVTLGLVPGAGGTQRLPRLVGVSRAAELITSGKPVDARQALALGLVDEVAAGDVVEAALARARALAGGQPWRRTGTLPVQADDAALELLRTKHRRRWEGQPAHVRALELVGLAARVPLEEGLAAERAAFEAARDSPQRRALVHLFFAERAAGKVEGLPAPREVRSAAVIGGGTMGTGIATALANAGLEVHLLEVDAPGASRARAALEKGYRSAVEKGAQAAGEAQEALGRIEVGTGLQVVGQVDLVLEAVFEDLELKRRLLAEVGALARPGAVLASNTSTLDLDALAQASGRPGDVVGLHFFSPAQVMKLLEVVRGAATAPDVLATALALARRLKKVAVVAGNADGFIGNRILAVYGRECDFMLEEGATPWQVDAALQGFGFPLGLYLMRDLAGLDVSWRIRQYREAFRPRHLRASPIADRLCQRGWFGRKTGRGYYEYPQGQPVPSPEVEALVREVSQELGFSRRGFSDEEIVTRVLTAMANEGLKVVGDQVAARASDVDVVYANGYGFPRHLGGPLWWAHVQGLPRVLAQVEGFFAQHGELWTPAPLLRSLVAEGRALY